MSLCTLLVCTGLLVWPNLHSADQPLAHTASQADPILLPEFADAAGADTASLELPQLPPLDRRPKSRILLVQDGDTVRLADRRSIRLACIDAPDLAVSSPTLFADEELREKNFRLDEEPAEQAAVQPPNRGKARAGSRRVAGAEQYFARQAQQALRSLALKQEVVLQAPVVKKDPQGRLVADVRLEDGTSLAAWLVENGYAYVVEDADYPKAYVEALQALQARAMRQKKGFWDVILRLEAARLPWTGNTETRLFYAASDVRAQQIKPRLRQYFGTLQDAFLQGYAPASSRSFWPDADKAGTD